MNDKHVKLNFCGSEIMLNAVDFNDSHIAEPVASDLLQYEGPGAKKFEGQVTLTREDLENIQSVFNNMEIPKPMELVPLDFSKSHILQILKLGGIKPIWNKQGKAVDFTIDKTAGDFYVYKISRETFDFIFQSVTQKQWKEMQ